MNTFTLISAVAGDRMPEGATELAESAIAWDQLPDDAQAWASRQGYGTDESELLYVIPGEITLIGWETYTVKA